VSNTNALSINKCQMVDEVKINTKYDSRLSTLVFGCYHICLSARIRENTKGKRLGWSSQDSARSGCTGLSGVHRTVSDAPDWSLVNWPLSGIRQRRTAKIHRTVR
jgi:hypothetical protein